MPQLTHYSVVEPHTRRTETGLFLDSIHAVMVEFQEKIGNMYNPGATPAGGTSYRFVNVVQKRFPKTLQVGTDEQPDYTHASQLPVDYTHDPFDVLHAQESLQLKYTGGTLLHLYMPIAPRPAGGW